MKSYWCEIPSVWPGPRAGPGKFRKRTSRTYFIERVNFAIIVMLFYDVFGNRYSLFAVRIAQPVGRLVKTVSELFNNRRQYSGVVEVAVVVIVVVVVK